MTTPRETEEAKLLIEYQQLCEDWRSRDRYVLDKLGAAGILFGLLGVALGTVPSTAWFLKLSLVSIGAFFSLILSISIAKDTYYRDGTEKLLRYLSAQLGISGYLQNMEPLKDINDLGFTRKIAIKLDEYSLNLPNRLKWVQNPLLKPHTFKWILYFYLVSLVSFVFLFILIAVDAWIYWRYGLKLPI